VEKLVSDLDADLLNDDESAEEFKQMQQIYLGNERTNSFFLSHSFFSYC
jgi:hypothetical protein